MELALPLTPAGLAFSANVIATTTLGPIVRGAGTPQGALLSTTVAYSLLTRPPHQVAHGVLARAAGVSDHVAWKAFHQQAIAPALLRDELPPIIGSSPGEKATPSDIARVTAQRILETQQAIDAHRFGLGVERNDTVDAALWMLGYLPRSFFGWDGGRDSLLAEHAAGLSKEGMALLLNAIPIPRSRAEEGPWVDALTLIELYERGGPVGGSEAILNPLFGEAGTGTLERQFEASIAEPQGEEPRITRALLGREAMKQAGLAEQSGDIDLGMRLTAIAIRAYEQSLIAPVDLVIARNEAARRSQFIGQQIFEDGHLTSAVTALEEARSLYASVENATAVAQVESQIANAHRADGNFALARGDYRLRPVTGRDVFETAALHYVQAGNALGAGEALVSKAVAFDAAGQLAEAARLRLQAAGYLPPDLAQQQRAKAGMLLNNYALFHDAMSQITDEPPRARARSYQAMARALQRADNMDCLAAAQEAQRLREGYPGTTAIGGLATADGVVFISVALSYSRRERGIIEYRNPPSRPVAELGGAGRMRMRLPHFLVALERHRDDNELARAEAVALLAATLGVDSDRISLERFTGGYGVSDIVRVRDGDEGAIRDALLKALP